MPQYRRLTPSARRMIEQLNKLGRTFREIAHAVGCTASSICRELQRNSNCSGYCAEMAQKLADQRRTACRRAKVITGELAGAFHRKLRRGWSPEMFSKGSALQGEAPPSTSTFYRYARFRGWSRRLLPRSGKRGAGRYLQHQSRLGRLSIMDRPEEIDLRETFGHWERDTLHTAKGTRLLVLLERKSRYLLIGRLKKRTARETTQVTLRLLKRASLPALSMTNDNGTEFNDSQNLGMPVYFCTPGKPQQRGSVENINGKLRRYFKRSTDLDCISNAQIRRIESNINDRPKKCLGFRTAAQISAPQKLHWQ